jgi:hypothetical protein
MKLQPVFSCIRIFYLLPHKKFKPTHSTRKRGRQVDTDLDRRLNHEFHPERIHHNVNG